MSHHKSVIVDGVVIGHVRITNDGEILHFWHSERKTLFLPEKVVENDN